MKSVLVFILLIFFFLACAKKEKIKYTISSPPAKLHESGLIEGEGLPIVLAHCTSCHSAKLITQNRATREGWEATIQWMQRTQNLWQLGENEKTILDYLAKNYAPKNTGRRKPLTDIEWYEMEKD